MAQRVFKTCDPARGRALWRVYISDDLDLDGLLEHSAVADTLRYDVQPDDEVHVYITTPGGDTDVAEIYKTAIEDCPGVVTTVSVGRVASGGTLIFLAGDHRVVKPGSYFMFHTVQTSVTGDIFNADRRASFWLRHFNLYLGYYERILTEGELKDLEKGLEIYFTAEEMEQRLKERKDGGIEAKE